MHGLSDWMLVKERLNNLNHAPPLVSEGDMWWASIGLNVGAEIHGKSRLFSRPVVIYKKLSHSFYLVIPTTTVTHTGSWYVPFNHQGRIEIACIHQARTIDYRRLSNKLGTVSNADFDSIKEGFRSLYGI